MEAGGGGQLSSLNELKCRMHEGSEGRRQQLKCVFVCYVVHHFCLYFKESKFLWTLQLLTEFLTFLMLICSSGRSSRENANINCQSWNFSSRMKMSDQGKTDFRISGQKLLPQFKRSTGSLLVLTQPSRDCFNPNKPRSIHVPTFI